MGNLDTALNVLDLVVGVATYNKISDIQFQGLSKEIADEIYSNMKNLVFKFKQSAGDILEDEESSKKTAAVSLKLIEYKFDDLGISPDFFPEFSDKEYVVNVDKLIRSNFKRIYKELPQKEANEVDEAVSLVLEYKDYDRYISLFEETQDYLKAKELISIYHSKKKWEIDTDKDLKAKKTINLLQQFVDPESFLKIDEMVNSNLEKAKEKKSHLENEIKNLIGDIPTLSYVDTDARVKYAIVRIHRLPHLFGAIIEVPINIDNVVYDKIGFNENKEIQVTPGKHSIFIGDKSGKSNTIVLNLRENEILNLEFKTRTIANVLKPFECFILKEKGN